MDDTGYRVVLATVGSPEEARAIADALVEKRLAGCVSRLPGLSSVYRWQGRIERAEETLLVIKTSYARVDEVVRQVREMSSYSVPEVIALAVVSGNPDYLAWLGGEVSLP